MNVQFAPNGGWQLPPEAKGIAFSMFLNDEGIYGMVFLLEYTLPRVECDASVTWDTKLRLQLPSGVCFGLPGQCDGGVPGFATFQLITIEDPQGRMGTSANGMLNLRQAITSALSAPIDPERTMSVGADDEPSAEPLWLDVLDEFQVDEGDQAKIYVGVAASLANLTLPPESPQWICTGDCVSSNNEAASDNGMFTVEGGPEGGVIGLGFVPR